MLAEAPISSWSRSAATPDGATASSGMSRAASASAMARVAAAHRASDQRTLGDKGIRRTQIRILDILLWASHPRVTAVVPLRRSISLA